MRDYYTSARKAAKTRANNKYREVVSYETRYVPPTNVIPMKQQPEQPVIEKGTRVIGIARGKSMYHPDQRIEGTFESYMTVLATGQQLPVVRDKRGCLYIVDRVIDLSIVDRMLVLFLLWNMTAKDVYGEKVA